MSKYLEETVRLQSEKRREWIREIRRERLQGIAEGASSAPRLASSSAVLFPGRNECPGTHCSLIEQEEREDSSCQICQVIRFLEILPDTFPREATLVPTSPIVDIDHETHGQSPSGPTKRWNFFKVNLERFCLLADKFA